MRWWGRRKGVGRERKKRLGRERGIERVRLRLNSWAVKPKGEGRIIGHKLILFRGKIAACS